ncbi:class I SAM-dependent DNA methyltransferase [Spirochaeta cellobiosiphila]|uniref:class I SAM-dependent DNA methyltransferase n=1 Tax=Spirochaeta cellobiosiphila TaxID=504483 RepID=UPI000417BE91|nr:class I SAM-dependent methyltransferase [Spirochaeta cellobiosiphila]
MNQFDSKSHTWDQEQYHVNRARIIAEDLKSHVQLTYGYTAMDFGCGTGLLGFHFLKDAGNFTFVDTSQGMIDKVKNKLDSESAHKVHCHCGDLDDEERTDYDLIMSLLAFHHVEDYKSVIHSLVQKLQSKGYFCLADLVTEDGSFHGDVVVPHLGFDPEVIASLLEQEGLERISLTYPFTNTKDSGGQIKEYPVFLLIYQKP